MLPYYYVKKSVYRAITMVYIGLYIAIYNIFQFNSIQLWRNVDHDRKRSILYAVDRKLNRKHARSILYAVVPTCVHLAPHPPCPRMCAVRAP